MSKKYKKNKKQMVDMSRRLEVSIIEATEEEMRQTDKELEKLNVSIENKMKEFEEQLSKLLTSYLSSTQSMDESVNAAYFIEEYRELTEKNTKCALERINQYKASLIDLYEKRKG